MTIFARTNSKDFLEIDEAIVVNPGEWFGKTWLLQVHGNSLQPENYVVEADNVCDAIDIFSESEFGPRIHVSDWQLDDYPEESRHYDGHGRVIDTDWLHIFGQEHTELPWPCRYFGDRLPRSGLDPRIYDDYMTWLEDNPHVALCKREDEMGVSQLERIRS